MIPVAIGVTVGKIVYDMQKSDKLNEQAEKKTMKSFARIADAQNAQREAEDTMNHAVLRLANRKRAVLSTSMKDFLNLYERLIKINFTDSEGIKELQGFSLLEAEGLHAQVSLIHNMPASPVITKNMVVGWLFGGGFGAVTSSIVDDAERSLDQACIQSKQANAIVQQAETINLAYQAITERANRMTEVLTKLNILMVKGLQQSNAIVEKNGIDKKNYTLDDRKSLAACINLAGAVKTVLDVPIIDKNGELTQKSLETIHYGEQCLQAMEFVISNM